jgi:hypothetical protein
MELFTKEIEEISVLDYGMSKVEDYYYLSLSNEDNAILEESENDQQKDEEGAILEPIPNDDDVIDDEHFSKIKTSSMKSESIFTDVDADERAAGQDSSTECASCVKTEENKEIEGASIKPSETFPGNLTPDSLELEKAFVEEKSEDAFDKSSPVSGLESDEKDKDRSVQTGLHTQDTLTEVESDALLNYTVGDQTNQTDEHLTNALNNEQPIPEEASKQGKQESANVSTSLDLSMPLTVITSPGEDHSCCEDLSTPVSEFANPVDATSTPIKIQPDQGNSLDSRNGSIRLISSSHQSDILDKVPTLDEIKGDNSLFTSDSKQDKESEEEEKRGEKSPLGSSTKSSPRNPRDRKMDITRKLNFWLVLRLSDNDVDIYFHTR